MGSVVSNTKLYGDSHAAGVASWGGGRVAVVIGQSNGRGTTFDSTYGSQLLATIHPGFTPTFYDVGGPVTTYHATDTGSIPYLFELMKADGSTPTIVRWAQDGVGEVGVRETQLPSVLVDLATLGIPRTAVDLVWLIHGEEDSTTPALAANYRDIACERIHQVAESYFPNAIVAQNLLRSTAYGADYAIVRAAQATVTARRANRRLVDTLSPTPIDLFDTVHYSSGPGGGYADAASRLWALLA